MQDSRILITDDWLEANGWEQYTLFYQVSGGADEDDLQYWEKENVVLSERYPRGHGYNQATSSDLNYINGFPEDDTVVYIDELNL